MEDLIERYKYIALCAAAFLLMTIKNPDMLALTFTYQGQQSKTPEFEPQNVSMYSPEQLKLYLSNSHRLEPASIVMTAKALAGKEQSAVLDPKDCSNCESSLLHVSEALSKEQKKIEKYEDKEKAETISRWANFLVILIFGALAHYLNHLKTEHPEKDKYYERKLSLLNFVWVVLTSGIAIIF